MIELLSYIIIGLAGGLASGLLGIGGGAITVPALALLFSYLGFPKENIMHTAIGTSLASMLVNTSGATYFHHKKGHILWDILQTMIPGIIVGSIGGALVAKVLSTTMLQWLFGGFSCLIGLYLLTPKWSFFASDRKKLSPLKLIVFSTGISLFSNVLGIGGGTILVPLFTYYRFDIRKTIGTSIAASFLITSLGTIEYTTLSLQKAPNSWSLGYIYLPALILISITSILGSFYGTKLVHVLRTQTIRKCFAFGLLIVGSLMLFM